MNGQPVGETVETARTPECEAVGTNGGYYRTGVGERSGWYLPIDFARALERQRNEVRAELERVKADVFGFVPNKDIESLGEIPACQILPTGIRVKWSVLAMHIQKLRNATVAENAQLRAELAAAREERDADKEALEFARGAVTKEQGAHATTRRLLEEATARAVEAERALSEYKATLRE